MRRIDRSPSRSLQDSVSLHFSLTTLPGSRGWNPNHLTDQGWGEAQAPWERIGPGPAARFLRAQRAKVPAPGRNWRKTCMFVCATGVTGCRRIPATGLTYDFPMVRFRTHAATPELRTYDRKYRSPPIPPHAVQW